MGTLGNSVFQIMMGWLRNLSMEVWSAVTSPEGGSLLTWIGQHWLMLAVILCAGGLITDALVYLFRWRPDLVWRSFFRRMRRRRKEREEAAEEVPEETAEPAGPPVSAYSGETSGRGWRWEEAGAPRVSREAPAYPEEEGSFHAYPDEPFDEEETPEETTARFEQAILPRRRRMRVRTLLSDEETRTETAPPQQLIDRREAYRRPVYPHSWRAEEGDEE